jgi:hypothetical protein
MEYAEQFLITYSVLYALWTPEGFAAHGLTYLAIMS